MKKGLVKLMACVMIMGSLVACGEKKEEAKENTVKNDVKVEALTAAVKEELGENYWPTKQLTESEAADLYQLTLDNAEEVIAEVPMMATNADMILIVKAKEGKVEDVKKEVEALRQSKVDDTMQYPMNIQKIAASSVNVVGNYVCYVQLGGSAADLETDEEIRTGCEADNKKAMEVIENQLKSE
ncbi:MAG: DUF4358 domain-containing protein [bacterium]|nr:DUF4358 domain-containing protein [bacterium]